MFKKSINLLKIFLILIFIISLISTVNSADINNTNNIISIDNNTSIQDTIKNATSNDIIYLNPGKYIESGISVDKTITLIGNGSREDIVIDGNRSNSIFILRTDKVSVTFINITFINGYSKNYGGAIDSELSKVYVDNCVFINNTAFRVNGGAISSAGTSKISEYLFVNNSLFVGNYAGHDGGAICHYRGLADIYNSIFIDNYAIRDGGAIRGGVYTTTNIYACEFYENYALEWGGAVYVWPGISKIIDSIFISNEAGTHGGAFTTSGQVTVTGSIIINNTAGWYGGAIFISEETPMIPSTTIFNDNVIIGNHAPVGTFGYIVETTSKESNFDGNWWGEYVIDWNKMVAAWEDVPEDSIPIPHNDSIRSTPPEWYLKYLGLNTTSDDDEEDDGTEIEEDEKQKDDKDLNNDNLMDLNDNLFELPNSTVLNIFNNDINGSEMLETILQELTQIVNGTDVIAPGISGKKAHNLIVDKNTKKSFAIKNYEVLVVLIIFVLICIVGYKRYKI